MKLADKILEQTKGLEMHEAQHYNTKVRGIDSSMGSRKIRLGVQENMKGVKNMIDSKHPTPNPADKKSKDLLSEAVVLMEQTIHRLKEVKDRKKPYESLEEDELKANKESDNK